MVQDKITLQSGSPLLGSPVIYRIVAEDYSGKPNLTFHRVKLSVTVESIGLGYAAQTYELSSPVATEKARNEIDIDISSTLRAYIDDYEYAPFSQIGSQSMPVVTARVEAWDEYMSNGRIYTSDKVSIGYGTDDKPVPRYFIMGAFTDRERIASSLLRGVDTLTRKPTTGEVIPFNQSLYVYPDTYAYTQNDWFTGKEPSAPTIKCVQTESAFTANAQNTVVGRSVYVTDDDDGPYTHFQFVNGYGVLESAFAITLPEESVEKEVAEYSISVPMAFNKINRNVVRKRASRHIFKMSSGPVTEDWQHWWQEEFLNTPQAWMLHDGSWLPVSIVPENETDGINRANSDLSEVLFSVKLNIEGML